MITRGLRELVARDWAAVRASKDRYWSERIASLGAIEGLRIADELRRQVMAQVPNWPNPEDRRADFEAHVRLASLLQRGRPTSRT